MKYGKAYMSGSIDLKRQESFRDIKRNRRVKVGRTGYGRFKSEMKFQSVLRKYDESWLKCSILERKECEMVSVLSHDKGKNKRSESVISRPILISSARESRWRNIACRGRKFAGDIKWSVCGIDYAIPDGSIETIFSGHFDLKYANDDACIVLKKNSCCSACSAELINRSDIDNEADYLFVVPLFEPCLGEGCETD
ncbi:MAG: hypothetical protein JKY80_04825 [Mariprofundaceae bacterium]|nr:hypothetical protein [Mariprofundaceae bacterium]